MKANKPLLVAAIEGRVLLYSFIAHDLLGSQKRLLVAVSGGQDSVCLLHILANLQRELNLHIAHLDHGLRGAESAADARYVARLAKRLGIPATIEKRDVKSFRAKHKMSLEEAAREVRYAFLADVADAIGTDRVAVAHTGDDHIETVLMHLIRGSGLRGLRGLQPVSIWRSGGRSLKIIRPLLVASRSMTGAYCKALHLRPRTDSSNLSLTPFRNKVRLELLPALKKYNPKIEAAVKRTSVQAADTLDFLDEKSTWLRENIVHRENDTFVFNKPAFLDLPNVLQSSLVFKVLEELSGDLSDIESRHIDEIKKAVTLPAGRSINLPGGLTFAVDYDKYTLRRGRVDLSPLPPLEGETRLKVPGETKLGGWRVMAAVAEGRDVPSRRAKHSKSTMPAEAGTRLGIDFTAYLDFNKTGSEIAVRSVKAGDIFQPQGMDKPKKVARFMMDARIPRSWRASVPIVVSPHRIVWVAGWRIDERSKITAGTRSVLRLEFQRTS